MHFTGKVIIPYFYFLYNFFLFFTRIHKVPGAHYESAATRKYIHGRTETIRSCSVESIAFAKTMLDKGKTIADKVVALREAIESHKKYANEVCTLKISQYNKSIGNRHTQRD